MLHFFTVIIAALSLSMDAFALSLALGTLNYNKKKILTISIIVGIFHFIMPLLGNLVSEKLLTTLPLNTDILAGAIFMLLSVQMLLSSLKENQVNALEKPISYFLFAFTVSIDSFSLGIGINAISTKHIYVSTIFMFTSFIFTLIGLLIGKKISKYLGKYAILFGSVLLFILSLHYLL